jgi:hypothetical protein
MLQGPELCPAPPGDDLGYRPVTIWHFPDDPRIDGMRSSILYALGQGETGLKARDGLAMGFEPGDLYQQLYTRDTAWIMRAAQYFYPSKFLRSSLDEFMARQYTEETVSYGGDNGARPGAGAISGVLSPQFYVDKHTTASDEETSLIFAAYTYYKASGDVHWLKTPIEQQLVIDRLNSAMAWLLSHRLDSGSVLIWRGDTTDWGDVKRLPADNPVDHDPQVDGTTLSLYDQALTYMTLLELAEMNETAGRAATASDLRKWAGALRTAANEAFWQPKRGFYRTRIHLAGGAYPPFDEDEIVSIANAVAIYAGLADAEKVPAILDNLERGRRSMGATKPGVSLYPPYPSGYFSYSQMGEGKYQNGGLWDWWGGVQISAEFQQGFSFRGLTHLRQVAFNWATHPQDLAEWEMARDGTLEGTSDYGAGGGTVGEAVVKGLFGVTLTADELQLTPRLGDHSGFIRVYLPASDRYVAYCSGVRGRIMRLEYGTNHDAPFQIRVTTPPEFEILKVNVDGETLHFDVLKMGEDELYAFVAPPGRHSVEIQMGPD